MPGIRYTAEELRFLRDSPLVKKPTALPPISQWIEAQNTQRSAQRKADENDNPAKRPSLFETRSRVSQSGNRDEIFLGPKLSFATATAARQATKGAAARDKSPNDDTRRKGERGIGRDRSRDRPRQANVQPDDGRVRARARRDSDGERDRPALKLRNGHLGGDDTDASFPTPKRGAPGKGKFEQPWFREQKDKPADEPREDRRTSWRDKERRVTRGEEDDAFGGCPEDKVSWMNAPKGQEPDGNDLAAFMKSMKAKDGIPEEQPAPTPHEPEPDMSFSGFGRDYEHIADDVPLFGLLGDTKFEAKKTDEDVAAKKPDKPKMSRFFNPSTVQNESRPAPRASEPSQQCSQPETPLPASVIDDKPSYPMTADKLGFERILQQLRLGNPSDDKNHVNGGPHHSASYPPGNNVAPMLSPPPQSATHRSPERERFRYPSPPHSPNGPVSPQARRQDAQVQHSQVDKPGDKNKFFFDLMNPPRVPGSPSVDAEIYGRSYVQRDRVPEQPTPFSDNKMNPSTHKMQGPPPGLSDNQRAFTVNQGIDIRPMSDLRIRGPPSAKLVEHQQTLPQLNEMHRHMLPLEQRMQYNGPPQYEPRQQQIQHTRALSQDNVTAPPGLYTAARPGMPPMAFPPMLHQQNGLQQKSGPQFSHPQPGQQHLFQPQPPQYLQQHLLPQQQVPHQQNRGPPPSGPPPGFMNGVGMPGMQPPGLGARRGLEQQIPQPPQMRTNEMMHQQRMQQMMSPGYPSAGYMR